MKDATTDPRSIRGWWPEGRTYNIGARVPSGLLVLDFDPQNGGSVAELEQASGISLPPTLVVHSGRGEGSQHRYYRHPGAPVSARRLPPGIDVKTDRGYCVVPPSLHPVTGQPYRWEVRQAAHLPPEVVALLRPAGPDARLAPGSRRGGHLERQAAGLVDHVAQLAEGNRNAGLYWAACRALEQDQPATVLDLLEQAACRAGLTPVEARNTIASARRAGAAS